MNLDTLIEILNDYREEFGGDAEVRLMTQQNWPFENRICGVTSGRDMNEADDDDERTTTTKTSPTTTRLHRRRWPDLLRQQAGLGNMSR